MEIKKNKMLFSGSIVTVYALQGFLLELGISSVIYDPVSEAAAAGFGAGALGLIELYVNEFDFEQASTYLNEFNKSL